MMKMDKIFIFNKTMERLIVSLTAQQQRDIVRFFLENPDILQLENYVHTRSPLDNLEHYMWEEMQEKYHVSIRKNWEKNGNLSNVDINRWIDQEIAEKEGK